MKLLQMADMTVKSYSYVSGVSEDARISKRWRISTIDPDGPFKGVPDCERPTMDGYLISIPET
jgi:hypothetical protein